MHRIRPLPFLLLLLVLLYGGCSRSRPNVVLMTFDTTRWDHVGYATGKQDLTPALDALAREGTWFATCLTCQPNTLPAHTTIMTGLEPYHHGVRNNGTYIVPKQVTTLAELFRERGYATHAIVSAFVLDSQFGLDQGFDTYDDDLSGGPKQKMFMFKEIKASQTADKAIKWLEEERPREKPFFLWLHFFDPHADYEPPEDVAMLFPGDPYSGEIHYADRELARVLATLKKQGVFERTLVVFTADHGDGLGEHGENTHGIFIYESTTRVPLLLRGPGVPRGRRVEALARSVDIAPTVIQLAGLRKPPDLDGASLVDLWRGKGAPRVAYVETLMPRLNFGWAEVRGLRDARSKVIEAPRPEVYDLSRDPAERENLVRPGSPVPEPALPLFEELRRRTAADPFTRGEQQEVAVSAETREKLRSLGYVWGAPATADRERPDPKDRVVYWEAFQQAQGLIRRNQFEPALLAIRKLLEVDADNVVALGSLANVLVRTHQREEALAVFRRMMVLDPRREAAYLGAARLLREMGRPAEAEPLVRSVIEMQPENPEGYTALGDHFLELGQVAEAEGWFRKALAIDPHSSTAASGLGNCLNRAGRLDEARQVLAQAFRRDPTSHALAYNLAVVSERLGDQQGALKLYQAAVRLEPEHSMTWNNLGSLLDKLGKREDALRLVARAHELDPENLEATYNLGALLLFSGKAEQALPLLEEAHRRQPGLVQAAVFRARALEAVGRQGEALAAWRQLARQQPLALLQVARLEARAGRSAEARQALEEALSRGGAAAREAAAKIPALAPLLQAR
ncbi:MAG: sulfatase-like hydrolase/transferase [Thermoanaerobaculaceae bacterium]|nr:sulfatase-like hydrolase/transferase [Thermoanaerobaculaceae bacterium]